MKRSKQYFLSGFSLSLLTFIIANLYSFSEPDVNPRVSHEMGPFGFPISIGSYGGAVTHTEIHWGGLILNIICCVAISWAVGTIANLIASRIAGLD